MWVPLSMLSDGLNTLLLPHYLAGVEGRMGRASLLGIATFVGLTAAMLAQPLAGALSDRLRPRSGRRVVLGAGIALTVVALSGFLLTQAVAVVLLTYLAVQLGMTVAQAALQGFIPDLIPQPWRGRAAGIKSFMDIGGAMIGFVLLGEVLGAGRTGLAVLVLIGMLLIAYGLTVALVRETPPTAARAEATLPSLADAFRLDLRAHAAFAWLVASRFLFLLGTYIVGRFLLYFVGDRLAMAPDAAAEQAGMLLAGLALVTVLAAVPAGWLADRLGRTPLMLLGAALSAAGVLLLIAARSPAQILLFGGLMSLGSGAFTSANWALTADLAPPEEAARFMALANFGTVGASAAAGLFGPLFDMAEALRAGTGYPALFAVAALAFLASAVALRSVRVERS